MALSLNEIKKRAIEFSKEWEGETREHAEAKSFWEDFFNVFGISRRRVASFEEPVKKLGNRQGFIDLFWKGNLIVEHKSKGKDLDMARNQAMDYFYGLKEYELPKFVLVSDFETFQLHDLEEKIVTQFKLDELHKHIHLFGFISGYQKKAYKEEDPVNIKAAEEMGALHDQLKAAGYSCHQLELLLVRILFCLFADDTGIFEKGIMLDYLEQKTNEDGSDLGAHLELIFQTLNTSREQRQKNIDESLDQFPYVNGGLFEEHIAMAAFDSDMRATLLKCCNVDWSKISPAIFGSLFQSVMDQNARRELGAHYTSEKNILKLIKPLFLDELHAEFEKVKKNRKRLIEFHDKIAGLRFLDPACGCGNFLVIAYRELRLLEIEVLKQLRKDDTGSLLDVSQHLSKIDVDCMYGIEVEEFPARIAEVAMWLMDHQLNIVLSEVFGQYVTRIPLKKSATIVNGNALRMDWQEVIAKDKLNYILGNPPFVGKQLRTKEQNEDMAVVFEKVKTWGVLDYVTSWYIKAAEYIQGTNIEVAFVSTNSISQGEQVGVLWNELFQRYHIKIHFAHRTFKWTNEARGKAGVYVVIIGFANFDTETKRIFDYEHVKGEAQEIVVGNINPYLVAGDDIVICKRRRPICEVPAISFGNMPNDGGNLLLNDEEKKELIKKFPGIEGFIRLFLSAKEFINGENRWCLWLVGISPNELRQFPAIMERIERVRDLRLGSNREGTKKLADMPTLFGEIRQPDTDFVLIPRHSSENRKYIPMGFFSKEKIVADSCLFVPKANLFHFGVLTSDMHMTWVKHMCGRIKSDFRYSNDIVYNNFPWPENLSDKHKQSIEEKAKQVLDVRAEFPESSLADLYDPIAMPPKLVKAHQELDKAVDQAYRSKPKPFQSDTERIEFLFGLYERYTRLLG